MNELDFSFAYFVAMTTACRENKHQGRESVHMFEERRHWPHEHTFIFSYGSQCKKNINKTIHLLHNRFIKHLIYIFKLFFRRRKTETDKEELRASVVHQSWDLFTEPPTLRDINALLAQMSPKSSEVFEKRLGSVLGQCKWNCYCSRFWGQSRMTCHVLPTHNATW